jgi:hypothetical protein
MTSFIRKVGLVGAVALGSWAMSSTTAEAHDPWGNGYGRPGGCGNTSYRSGYGNGHGYGTSISVGRFPTSGYGYSSYRPAVPVHSGFGYGPGYGFASPSLGGFGSPWGGRGVSLYIGR